MTDEKLREIAERAQREQSLNLPPHMTDEALNRILAAWEDRQLLLDALKTAQRREALARAVLERVLQVQWDDDDGQIIYVDGPHLVEVQDQARAWLAAGATAEGAEVEGS